MNLDTSTTGVMTRLIAAAESDGDAARDLRMIAQTWVEDLPPKYLRQVGEILLRSHLDEQQENAGLN